MDLTDAAAIVTGGASGLGAATAANLAGQGAQVYALDLADSIEQAPAVDNIAYLTTDVTNEDDVRAAVHTAADSPAPLRTVVNCAGIGPSARILSRRGTHDLDMYAKVVQVNLVGTFTVLTVAAEAMSQTHDDEHGQRGVIVNTASIAAYEGQIGQVAYASSKGGVVSMTLPAARDLAQHGIRVCTIAPGIVDTPMLATVSEEIRSGLASGVPFPQRLCTPAEYADLVAMIIDHDYLNGETIRMDGALRMAPR